VPAMHVGALAGQSCLLRHWTHAVAWQKGAAVGQSPSPAQTTQRPSWSQIGVAVPAHCALLRHCTHDDVVRLQ
jgi:hypothetical protein